MDVENELRKRFATAINKFVQPRILFGPKWVRAVPGEEGRYQFIGTDKVAKATGIPQAKIAKKILAHLKLGGLDLTARGTPSGTITLTPAAPAKPAKPPEKAPAGKPKHAAKGKPPADKKRFAKKKARKP